MRIVKKWLVLWLSACMITGVLAAPLPAAAADGTTIETEEELLMTGEQIPDDLSVNIPEENTDSSEEQIPAESTVENAWEQEMEELPVEAQREDEDSLADAYNVTLNADGGLFLDEWDDMENDVVGETEILNRIISSGEAVTVFPIKEQEGYEAVFLGWSFERGGDLVSREYEEYVPVKDCVLHAVWEEKSDTESSAGNDGTASAIQDDLITVEEPDTETVLGFDAEEVEVTASEENILEDVSEEEPDTESPAGNDGTVNTIQDDLTIVEEPDTETVLGFDAEEVEVTASEENTLEEVSEEKPGTESSAGNDGTANTTRESPITAEDTEPDVITEFETEEVEGADSEEIYAFEEENNETDSEKNLEADYNSAPVEREEFLSDLDEGDEEDTEDVEKVRIVQEKGTTEPSQGGGETGKQKEQPVILITERESEETAFAESAMAASDSVSSGTCGDNLTWSLNSEGTMTISGTGMMKDYESYSGPWGTMRDSIKKIVIESGVTSIGKHAFIHCTELTSVSIPGSVKTIGIRAFNNCGKLSSVSMAYGIEVIEQEAFCFCTSLKALSIPNSVTSIGKYSFNGCKSLTSLTISSGLTTIGTYSFGCCEKLRSIVIPSGVKSIDDYAFYDCKELTKLTIPDSMQTIAGYAFENCVKLAEVTIPSGVKTIAEDAFYGCPTGFVVYGEEGSAADSFASKKGFIFRYLNAKSIAQASVSVPDQYYNGNVHRPVANVTLNGKSLKLNTDYKAEFYNNYRVGTATVTLTGIRNYSGTVKAGFQIKKGKQPITVKTSKAAISLSDTATITVAGAMNTTSFQSSNTAIAEIDKEGKVTPRYPGTVTITVTAEGSSNYELASKKIKITVKPYSIANASVSGVSDAVWTGKAITQTPKLYYNRHPLSLNTDYKVSYKNNTSVGTATIIIKGKGWFGGTVQKTFRIRKASQTLNTKVKAASVAVGKTSAISTSGAKGKVSYKSSNSAIASVNSSTGIIKGKKVGTVRITATSAATGSYKAASKTVTIKVVPAATSSLKAANQATGIKLTWKKVPGANGYLVYRNGKKIATIGKAATVTYIDKKANTNGTKYTYKIVAKASTGNSTLLKSLTVYRVARPAVKSAKNTASKKVTVTWGKNTKASGYELQYGLKKNFRGAKKVTIKKSAVAKKTISKLAEGKNYYFRIRTYKTVGKTKYYSVWSSQVAVKIKKKLPVKPKYVNLKESR